MPAKQIPFKFWIESEEGKAASFQIIMSENFTTAYKLVEKIRRETQRANKMKFRITSITEC